MPPEGAFLYDVASLERKKRAILAHLTEALLQGER